MLDTQALLELPEAQIIFAKPFMTMIDSAQPIEWIESEDSTLIPGGKYYYNRIQLIEALLKKVFQSPSGIECKIGEPIISQDKGKFAVTIRVQLVVGTSHFQNRAFYGVATAFASSIEQLTLATPRAFTEAKKHAAKQIGSLFGRDLNRLEEVIPQTPLVHSDHETNSDYNEVLQKLEAAPDRQTAETILINSSFKYNQTLKDILNKKPTHNGK